METIIIKLSGSQDSWTLLTPDIMKKLGNKNKTTN